MSKLIDLDLTNTCAMNAIKASPILRECLNKDELESPVPEFSTIRQINKLTPTQVCMALQCFLIRCGILYSENTEIYKHNSQYIFGAEDKLISPEEGIGIIDANEPIIIIYFSTFNIIDDSVRAIIDKRGTEPLSFQVIIKMFRKFLIGNLKYWNTIFKTYNMGYFYNHSLSIYRSSLLMLTHMHRRVLEHPLIVHSFFTPEGNLNNNNNDVLQNNMLEVLDIIYLSFDPYHVIEALWNETEDKASILLHNESINKSLRLLLRDKFNIHWYNKNFDIIYGSFNPQDYLKTLKLQSTYARIVILLYVREINDDLFVNSIIDLFNELHSVFNNFVKNFLNIDELDELVDDNISQGLLRRFPHMIYSYISAILEEVLQKHQLNPLTPITWIFEEVLTNKPHEFFIMLPMLEPSRTDMKAILKHNIEDFNRSSSLIWKLAYTDSMWIGY